MSLPPCRWLLPVAHFAIDAVILGLLIAQGAAAFRAQRSGTDSQLPRVLPVQEGTTVEWDPIFVRPSPRFMLLTAGNLPAALISTALRPRAHIQTRGHLWDPAWFAVHEAASGVIWCLIGLGIDVGRFRLRREMLGYLAGRAGCVALLPVVNLAHPAASLEAMVWLAFAIWGAGWCVMRGVKRLRPA